MGRPTVRLLIVVNWGKVCGNEHERVSLSIESHWQRRFRKCHPKLNLNLNHWQLERSCVLSFDFLLCFFSSSVHRLCLWQVTKLHSSRYALVHSFWIIPKWYHYPSSIHLSQACNSGFLLTMWDVTLVRKLCICACVNGSHNQSACGQEWYNYWIPFISGEDSKMSTLLPGVVVRLKVRQVAAANTFKGLHTQLYNSGWRVRCSVPHSPVLSWHIASIVINVIEK